MKKIISLIIFLVMGFVLCPLCFSEEPQKVTVGTTTLTLPIDVLEADTLKDGGTIEMKISDTLGKTLSFCLDHRLTVKKPYHVFLQADNSAAICSKEVPIGGQEEKALVLILQGWLDSKLSQAEQEKYLSKPFDSSQKEEYKIRLAVQFVYGIKNRDKIFYDLRRFRFP